MVFEIVNCLFSTLQLTLESILVLMNGFYQIISRFIWYLSRFALFYLVMLCFALFCPVLPCPVLPCFALFYSVLLCFTLFCPVLPLFASFWIFLLLFAFFVRFSGFYGFGTVLSGSIVCSRFSKIYLVIIGKNWSLWKIIHADVFHSRNSFFHF